MKKVYLLRIISISVSLLFITSQAFASPAAPAPLAQGTVAPDESTATPTATSTSTPATSGRQRRLQVYRGTITELSQTSLTLTLTDGTALPISLTRQTIIRIPGQSRKNLQVGMLANVLTLADENKNLTAVGMLVVPGKPLRVHRVGTVTAYTAGASITILATDGVSSYTFLLTNRTKILPDYLAGTLAIGSRVTIIAPRDPAEAGAVATGIVIHPAGSP